MKHDGTHADEASASDCARFSYGAGLPHVAANFHVDVACQDNAAGDGDMIFDDVVVIDHRSAQAKEKITDPSICSDNAVWVDDAAKADLGGTRDDRGGVDERRKAMVGYLRLVGPVILWDKIC